MTEHETQLIQVHPNGQVEFFCPLCDYHVIIGDNAITYLDYGDPNANHHGMTDGLSISQTAEVHDENLDVFDDFLRGLDETA